MTWFPLLLISTASTPPSASQCLELGFGDSVLCSTCDVLANATKSEALDAECRSCCVSERASTSTLYTQITLEICE